MHERDCYCKEAHIFGKVLSKNGMFLHVNWYPLNPWIWYQVDQKTEKSLKFNCELQNRNIYKNIKEMVNFKLNIYYKSFTYKLQYLLIIVKSTSGNPFWMISLHFQYNQKCMKFIKKSLKFIKNRFFLHACFFCKYWLKTKYFLYSKIYNF